MLTEQGFSAEARVLWKDIVAVNPDDRYAAAMLAAPPNGAERFLTVPGML